MFSLQARAAAALVLVLSGAAQAAVWTDATLADKPRTRELHATAPTLLTVESAAANSRAGAAPADIEGAAAPEPASIGLLLAGVGMIAVMSSRRRPR